MSNELLAIVAAIVLIAAVAIWVRSRRRHLTLWSRQGIPGPPPNLLFGNLLDYLRHGSPGPAQREWLTRYTPARSTHAGTVGFFMGGIPSLVTTDPELIRRVCITDFATFKDRLRVIPGLNPTGERSVNGSLLFCAPRRFEGMRGTINKSFTPSKLRGNVPLMRAAVQILINKLETSSGEQEVEMEAIFKRFTADVIARCAFGLDDPTLQNPTAADKKTLLLRACDVISANKLRDPFLIGAILFPGAANALFKPLILATYWILVRLLPFYAYALQPFQLLTDYITQVVKCRDVHPTQRQDLLQALMDSRGGGREHDGGGGLSQGEVAANGAFFYLAGYDTTSITLSFAMHYLVDDQDLQTRLRDEAADLLQRSDGKLDYNTVSELPLLDAVIKEVLRLHSPLTQLLARDSLKDYNYDATHDGQSFTIPRGTSVIIGMQQLHLDPVYWGDSAADFRPDRFLPDPATGEKPVINPLVYIPFGAGPRSCAGQRFALLTIKLTLASLLVRFRFLPCGRTQRGPALVDERFFVQHPACGIWTRVEHAI